jgi:hypothetical protein
MLSIVLTFYNSIQYDHNSKRFYNWSSKSDLEERMQASGDIYDDDSGFEIIPYIDSESSVTIIVNNVEIIEKLQAEKLEKKSWTSVDFNPELPKSKNIVSILRKTSVCYSQQFDWNDVDTFDFKNIRIRIGRDQNDREYFAGIEYLGKEPDDENDPDVTGGYDSDFEFFYHPGKKWLSRDSPS